MDEKPDLQEPLLCRMCGKPGSLHANPYILFRMRSTEPVVLCSDHYEYVMES